MARVAKNKMVNTYRILNILDPFAGWESYPQKLGLYFEGVQVYE